MVALGAVLFLIYWFVGLFVLIWLARWGEIQEPDGLVSIGDWMAALLWPCFVVLVLSVLATRQLGATAQRLAARVTRERP